MKKTIILLLLVSLSASASVDWRGFDVDKTIKETVDSAIDEKCNASNAYLAVVSLEYKEIWYDTASYELTISGSDQGGFPDYDVK